METEISQENSKIIKPTEEQPKDETNKVHPLMGNSPVLDEFLKLESKDIPSVPVEINVFDDFEVINGEEISVVRISSPNEEAAENITAINNIMNMLKEEFQQNGIDYFYAGSLHEIPNITTIFINSGSNSYHINYDTSNNKLLLFKDYLEMSGMTLEEFNADQINQDINNVKGADSYLIDGEETAEYNYSANGYEMVNIGDYQYFDDVINPAYSATVYTYPEMFQKRFTFQIGMMPEPEVTLSNMLYSEMPGQ